MRTLHSTHGMTASKLIEQAIENPAPVVDTATCAAILSCSPRTVSRMCECGKLRALKVMGMLRVNKAELFEMVGIEANPTTQTATNE